MTFAGEGGEISFLFFVYLVSYTIILITRGGLVVVLLMMGGSCGRWPLFFILEILIMQGCRIK